jgi:hypothetical protein
MGVRKKAFNVRTGNARGDRHRKIANSRLHRLKLAHLGRMAGSGSGGGHHISVFGYDSRRSAQVRDLSLILKCNAAEK